MAKNNKSPGVFQDPFKYDKLGNPKIVTIAFMSVMTVSVLIRLSIGMQNSSLPFFIKNVLGGNEQTIGNLQSIFMLSALVGRLFIGRQVDKRGRKPIMLLGILVYGIMIFMFSMVSSIPMLFLFRALQGVGFAAQSIALSTVITDMVPEDRLSEGIGYYGLSQSITQAIGPAIAVMLMDTYGYTHIFNIFSIFALLAFLVATTLSIDKFRLAKLRMNKENRDEKQVSDKENSIEKTVSPVTAASEEYHGIMKIVSQAIEPKSVVPALCAAFNGMAQTSVMAFLLLYGRDTLLIHNFALFYTVQAAAIAASRLFGGKLTTLFGHRKVILPALGIKICCMISMTFIAKTLSAFFIIAVAYGLCSGLIQPVINSMTVVMAPFERRGVANSTYFNFLDIGNAIGASLWGWVAVRIGLGNIFAAGSIFLVVVGVIFFHISGRVNIPIKARKK